MSLRFPPRSSPLPFAVSPIRDTFWGGFLFLLFSKKTLSSLVIWTSFLHHPCLVTGTSFSFLSSQKVYPLLSLSLPTSSSSGKIFLSWNGIFCLPFHLSLPVVISFPSVKHHSFLVVTLISKLVFLMFPDFLFLRKCWGKSREGIFDSLCFCECETSFVGSSDRLRLVFRWDKSGFLVFSFAPSAWSEMNFTVVSSFFTVFLTLFVSLTYKLFVQEHHQESRGSSERYSWRIFIRQQNLFVILLRFWSWLLHSYFLLYMYVYDKLSDPISDSWGDIRTTTTVSKEM